jgi:hypothetical protein
MSPESRQAIEQSTQLDSILLGDGSSATSAVTYNSLCNSGIGFRFAQDLSKVSAFPKAQCESCNLR